MLKHFTAYSREDAPKESLLLLLLLLLLLPRSAARFTTADALKRVKIKSTADG